MAPSGVYILSLACCMTVSVSQSLPCNESTILGFTHPTCDADGNLLPPKAYPNGVQGAMDASVKYYAETPADFFSHGIPPYAWATFTSGHFPTSVDIIAGMQDGMGLLGYLKYYRRAVSGRGGNNASAALQAAVYLGEYLTKWANTPPRGPWANVTRSTGINLEWPLEIACQGDVAFGIDCIETDRLGLAGFALLELHRALNVSDSPYLQQALHNARVLVAHQTPGNSTDAPWPWRVESTTGRFLNGHKNSDSVFPLRLLRALSLPPFSLPEFAAPAASLWAWIRDFQLPTASPEVDGTASLWVNFFEDRTQTNETNRNSWAALELARYLIESRTSGLDADWAAHVDALLHYALTLFGAQSGVGNTTLMGEQDDDRKPWGGASSKLGAVAAMYACAGGPAWYGPMGLRNAAHMSYYTDPLDGCRSAEAYLINARPTRGGWTEDAWLDVLGNVIDALNAAEGVC